MNATQGVILIMIGTLVLYLVWRDGILDNVQGRIRGSGGAHAPTPGSSGESGLSESPGAGAGSGAGGGGGGQW